MQYGYTMMDTARHLEPFCSGRIFQDQSGQQGQPGFDRLLDTVQKGDSVTIPSLSCLGSTISQMCAKWGELTRRDVTVSLLDFPENPASRDSLSGFMTYLLGTEQTMRRNSQEARQRKIRKGELRLGRRPKKIPPRFGQIRQSYEEGTLSAREAAARLGVSHTTFLRWYHESTGKTGKSGI